MSTFDEADHPRNHPTGASRFSNKVHSPVEAELEERSYDHRAGEPLPELPLGSRIDIGGLDFVRVRDTGEPTDWVDENGAAPLFPLDQYNFTINRAAQDSWQLRGWAGEVRPGDRIITADHRVADVISVTPFDDQVSITFADMHRQVSSPGTTVQILRPSEARHYDRDGPYADRLACAHDPRITAGTLDTIAAYEAEDDFYYAVAIRTDAFPSTLERVSTHSSYQVRYAVAANPTTSRATLERMQKVAAEERKDADWHSRTDGVNPMGSMTDWELHQATSLVEAIAERLRRQHSPALQAERAA